MSELLCDEDVDRRLNWPLGNAERLARRGKLPHFSLPDGAVRFQGATIARLLVHVPRADRQGVPR